MEYSDLYVNSKGEFMRWIPDQFNPKGPAIHFSPNTIMYFETLDVILITKKS